MQVGNKVVCINDTFPPVVTSLYYQLPIKDTVYTVRSVYLGRSRFVSNGSDGAEVGILLEELTNPSDPRVTGSPEMGFNSERFRIVEESVAVEIKVNHGEET